MARKGEFILDAGACEDVLERYRSGESSPAIARRYGVSKPTILKCLNTWGQSRTPSEAALVRDGKDPELANISKERWLELYCHPGSGYPSIPVLASRLGLSIHAVRRRLIQAGITPRTLSEQQELDLKFGRRKLPAGGGDGGKSGRLALSNYWSQLSHSDRVKVSANGRRAYAARAAEARRKVPCGWCGEVLIRMPSQADRHQACCNRSHAARFTAHRRREGSDAPRPLIVEKLIELAEKNRGWAETFEQLAKIGQGIGAGEPEIIEVMTRHLEGQPR